MAEDLYGTLGVHRGATAEELKRAYRRRARELHPDANPGDPTAEARFKEVARAYAVLSDPARRRNYDAFGVVDGAGPGASPFDGGLGDVFSMLFGQGFGGGATRPTGPPRGSDLEARVEVTFDEAVFGGQAELSVRTAVACEDCGGSGAEAGTSASVCGDCGGSGQVQRVRQSMLGQMVTTGACGRCGATGQVIDRPCGGCRGDGRAVVERTYTVDIPAGIDDGQTLRLPGRGAVGPRGGSAGDLYVHVSVRPHEHLLRDGYDLHTDLHVAVTQAVLGATVPLRTLEGDESFEVAAGTPSGTTVVLGRRGVPYVDGRGRGDLRVRIVVDIPERLPDDQELLVRQLAQLRGEDVAEPRPGLLARLRSALR